MKDLSADLALVVRALELGGLPGDLLRLDGDDARAAWCAARARPASVRPSGLNRMVAEALEERLASIGPAPLTRPGATCALRSRPGGRYVAGHEGCDGAPSWSTLAPTAGDPRACVADDPIT